MKNSINNKKDVNERLKKIFLTKFQLDFNTKQYQDVNSNLLGEHFQFEASDLLCLYCFVEKEFNINIPEKDIIDGKFCTFNNILDIINKQILDHGSPCATDQ